MIKTLIVIVLMLQSWLKYTNRRFRQNSFQKANVKLQINSLCRVGCNKLTLNMASIHAMAKHDNMLIAIHFPLQMFHRNTCNANNGPKALLKI